MDYICNVCGKSFTASRKTAFCSDCRTAKCVICGNDFVRTTKNPNQLTCSRKCSGVYRKQSGISQQVADKAQKTLAARYGATNASVFKVKSKICEYCGKEFIPTSNRQKWCTDPHYGPCPICGKSTLIRDMHIGPQCCSMACRGKLIEKTSLERYGAKNVFASDYGKAKIKETIARVYGDEEHFREAQHAAMEATMLDRYGIKSPLQSDEIKGKLVQTNMERYGVPFVMQNPDVQAKQRQTINANGGYGMANPKIREKIQKTIQAKCGIDNVLKSSDIQGEILHMPSNAVGGVGTRTVQKNYEVLNVFQIESEVKDFLLSIDPNMQIIMHDRKIIAPYEFDIYLPDYNFAIECNPTYTHNSSCGAYHREAPLPRNYHAIKSHMTNSAGIELFHIFGYEWVDTPDVIKSMLKARLGFVKTRIYARNTHIEEIPYAEASEFLATSHRQGFTPTKICLGLRLNSDNTLVSLMTFNPMKAHQGHREADSDDWELSRFCNLRDTVVVGGASKLFKYFVSNYEFEKLVSFSDIAHTSGKLYQVLGFTEVSVSAPSYVWVHLKTDAYYKRTACMKSKLKRLFNDPTLDIEHLTEKQIMEAHGYVQVFDSGLIRWEYKK